MIDSYVDKYVDLVHLSESSRLVVDFCCFISSAADSNIFIFPLNLAYQSPTLHLGLSYFTSLNFWT